MTKKVLVLAALAACVAATPALAQDKRVEVSVTAGWTFSDGVDGEGFLAPDLKVYNRVDPKDSLRWGLGVGFYTTEQVEVGFTWNQQLSNLTIAGPASDTRELGDQAINQYHGYFAYNMGDSSMAFRPYFLFGLGATQFGSVDVARIGGGTFKTSGDTQFSTTWGAGVKLSGPDSMIGARFGVTWTPTYIKSDFGGYWCDPYWGYCYAVGDPQYSNAWDLGGGIFLKF